ncbi:meiosis protein SPO22/ZIP4 like-domain-containing protein [Trametes maxima]|nr:meiosis protein SPO22/ZIP4 like-domain-containing protein [Trametes maxima]
MSDHKKRKLSPVPAQHTPTFNVRTALLIPTCPSLTLARPAHPATLASLKPKLCANGSQQDWNSLRSDLLHLSTLAESLSKHRPRAKKADDWLQRADDLDHQGVTLWNASVLQKDVPDDAYRSACAAMRLAGFRLIEAGMEHKPGVQSRNTTHANPFPLALTHLLQLASKAGSSLADVGDTALAASVLGSAAKYVDQLRAADDPQNTHAQACARAIVLYYSSQMETAFQEHNDGVADFMLEKVSESDQYLSLLTPSDRRTLAGKLLGIGKSMLKSSTPGDPAGNGARDYVKWIQRAFSIIEPLEDAADSGDGQLRRSILRTLARAYFLSSAQDPENLARAEASLQELMESVDSSLDHTSPEYQQLRWMRVAILKRRKAPHAALLEAFRSIIDHMQFSENTITDILQELRSLGHDHVLVTAIHLHCLQRAFDAQNSAALVYLDLLLLSLIYHCSKDDDHARATQDLAQALNPPKIPTTACLTLLWQFGDRHYHSKRWTDAADWFLVGTHRVFGSMSHISNAKCHRKAALCYVQCSEHAQASAIIRRCPPMDAATHYVALLIAAHQAVTAVREMVHASNFNKKMLLLATRLANDSGMKSLLLSVLEALLDASLREGVEAEAEAITGVFIPMLLRHFSTGKAEHRRRTKDVSWLWRTAYNTAVQGCTEWENQEDSISDLFDVTRQILQIYMQSPAVDTEADVQMFLINASFAGCCKSNHAAEGVACWQLVAQAIASCRDYIRKIMSGLHFLPDEDVQHAQSFLSTLSVFGVEIACQLKAWNRVLEIIEDTNRIQQVALGMFEVIADVLWVEKECPVDVLFAALEANLHASLDRAALSVEKFSRWLRAICTILLSRSSPADRTKAIGYAEQAVGVLQDHSTEGDPQSYTMDERQWLLATSYNMGIECLHTSLLDEAKRWFEAATAICRFMPDGESRSAKISKTYTHLLERYAH